VIRLGQTVSNKGTHFLLGLSSPSGLPICPCKYPFLDSKETEGVRSLAPRRLAQIVLTVEVLDTLPVCPLGVRVDVHFHNAVR
jgi:hypothetical protein